MKIYKIDVNHIALEDLLSLVTKVKTKYRNTGVSFTIFNSETNESEEIGYNGCNSSEWCVNSYIRSTYNRLLNGDKKNNLMIDEKKIEEAAQDCRFETISQCHGGFQYVPQCFSEEIDKETELIESAFKQGAKWAIKEFLKNLWHDAKEEPKIKKEILVDWRTGNRSVMFLQIKLNHWNKLSNQEIKRWLYIDDLLPKKKGGE